MKFFCGCNNESFFHFVSQVAKKKSRPARGRQRHVLRKTSQESSITRTTPHGKENGAEEQSQSQIDIGSDGDSN